MWGQLETISALPFLPLSPPHYSSPPTCGPASHLPALCLPLHLLSRFFFFFFFLAFFFLACFSPGGGSPEYCFIKPSAGPMARGFVVTVVQTRRDLSGSEFTEDPRLEGEIAMDHDGPLPGLTTPSHPKPSNWPAAPV